MPEEEIVEAEIIEEIKPVTCKICISLVDNRYRASHLVRHLERGHTSRRRWEDEDAFCE